ncbi:MAG: response regulator [Alphaproteobacteria bacterium]|nr:MAG: response regulator [Alphaproteobacteria bacterium]
MQHHMTGTTDSTDEEKRPSHELSDAQSDFLAVVSHEIRTPMQSIYGLLELILEENDGNETEKMANTAKDAATGLLEILDDILDLAKINAGKLVLEPLEIPLRTLAYGILECMEVKLHGDRVSLTADIAEDVPAVIAGDPKRLRQVLLNLVGNAIKFTTRGSVTLTINCQTQQISPPKQEDMVGLRFEIRDTGPGMSQDVAAKLFQPFTQADSSTTRKYGGTGLGLSICRKLVELMDGMIGVDSHPGQGSVFWFEIPAAPVSSENFAPLPDLAGLAVLSVEDHPAAAREIVTCLTSMGAKVENCGTYATGLQLLEQRSFDVAIIDQGLPDGLGVDLAKYAAEIRPFTGIVIYTARDDAGLQHSARALGATYLGKPASRLGLGEAVRAAARNAAEYISQRPHRILVAEDNPSVRDVLERQFVHLGISADFAENGIDAMNKLSEQDYGLLLTDLHMPEMDGYTLVARLRAIEEDENRTTLDDRMPVIALTADVQLSRRQVYLSRGFDECLLKPISLGQMRRLLIRWGLLREQEDSAEEQEQNTPETTHDNSPIDAEAAKELLGGFDTAAITEMLGFFVEMTAPLVNSLEKAHQDQDLVRLEEDAHSLKGAAHSACCTALGQAAAKIETLLQKGENTSLDDICRVKDEFDRIKAYLSTL